MNAPARFGEIIALPNMATWPKCRRCEGRAHPSARDGLCRVCDEDRVRHQEQAAERGERLRDARIPERYAWARFKAPELGQRVKSPRAIAAVQAWASSPKSDRLVLTGGTGRGKTSLACAALRAVALSRDIRPLFVDALELAQARRIARLGSEAPLVARALDDGLVVIDDLGQEARDPAGAPGHVVFHRHQHCRPTIFTTFMDAKGLADLYGGGVARRVFEGATVVRVDG